MRNAGLMKPSVPGRLHAQGLTTTLGTPADVVRHLGCVQSQLHDLALWAVARRTAGQTLVDLQAAFDHGDFYRTHILRPTWHFVDPEDIHWLLTLTGPRVRRLLDANTTGLNTPAVVDRSADAIAQLLSDGKAHTRAEIGAAFAAAGLPAAGQPLGDLVMHAEIDALIVNGPMRGKQHTYRLLPPRPVTQTRDELLARAARLYASGHGPIRDKDLAWWTGLTLGDSRRAIALGELRPLDVDGTQYWLVDEPVDSEPPAVTLLSNFDEYISYARDRDDYANFNVPVDQIMRRSGLLLIDGRLAGAWGRKVNATSVEINVETSATLLPRKRRALQQEAEAFGAFVGREPALVMTG